MPVEKHISTLNPAVRLIRARVRLAEYDEKMGFEVRAVGPSNPLVPVGAPTVEALDERDQLVAEVAVALAEFRRAQHTGQPPAG